MKSASYLIIPFGVLVQQISIKKRKILKYVEKKFKFIKTLSNRNFCLLLVT